jgi:hypothetical protein
MVEDWPEIPLPPELEGYRDLGGADFKAASEIVLANLGTREQMDEMIQLVRERIRIHEDGIAHLRACIQPNLKTQPALDALTEAHGGDADAQRALAESGRLLFEEQRALSAEIKALIARLDEIIRDQNNGA